MLMAFGFISLFPQGIGEDIFSTGKTMDLTISIPKSQLEVDGVSGYDPLSDAQVVLGDTRPDAYTALTTTGFDIDAPGQNYDITVVPEPSGLLMGAALLGAMAMKRGGRAARGLAGKFQDTFKRKLTPHPPSP